MNVVAKSLFGIYRHVGFWFWGVIAFVVVVASVVTGLFGGLDLSPIVLILLLQALKILVHNTVAVPLVSALG